MDYVDPNVSTGRFAYHTTGTLSSVFGGMYIGAQFGGPWGALGGTLIGGAFWAGEKSYDGLAWFANQLSRGAIQTENAFKNGWSPGR